MSKLQKVAAVAGVLVAVGAALIAAYKVKSSGDQPIMVGDGSVKFHYDNPGDIESRVPTELEIAKILHHAKGITVTDYTPSNYSLKIDLSGREWTLAGAGGANGASIVLDPFVLSDGVKAVCPSPWSGSGTDFTCALPSNGQLTPAQLTFTDKKPCKCCAGTDQFCVLTCPSGKCNVAIDYKF
jgi:hypothetical protein